MSSAAPYCMAGGGLTGLDAITLAHLDRPDPGHLAGAHRMDDGRRLRCELEGIPGPARDDRCSTAPFHLGYEKVVRLVAGRLGIGEPACGDKLRQHRKLIEQVRIEG